MRRESPPAALRGGGKPCEPPPPALTSPPLSQTAFHYGFIPLIIVLGMRTEPRPSLTSLLTPFS